MELDDVFWPVVANFQLFAKTKKIEIEKYWSYNKVMGTELVALELLITFEQKAEPCKLQGSGARRCFLTGNREFPTFHKRPKESNLKNIGPTTKSWEQNLLLSNCSSLLNRRPNFVNCKGVELDDVF